MCVMAVRPKQIIKQDNNKNEIKSEIQPKIQQNTEISKYLDAEI